METGALPGVSGASSPFVAAAAMPKPETDTSQQVKLQKVTPAKESQETLTEARDADEARYEALKRAAAEAASIDIYVVGDTRFTIYKDQGVYFTRFTSLRDGSVHIVPERELFSRLGKGTDGILLSGMV